MRNILICITAAVGLALTVSAAKADSLPLQAGERSLRIGTGTDTTATYACITVGMHPGQGQAGPGYDNVTYPVFVALQIQPGNGDVSQANANMEGMACRLMDAGTDVFDVITGKPFPPPPAP
jgi:hypothetical protein